MPKWNPMQLKAIETKQKNILVSASAGSGKTTVLIARLMDLVMKDHVAIDAILAMTFTEAAANEMKKRLAKSLQEALQTAQREEDRAYILRQLTSIQTAHISTIHSFCLSIIQEYYYMIGLSYERIGNIMDNGTMVLYQKQALDAAFERQYDLQDPIFLQLCQMFSARPEDDSALQEMIINLATLASSKPNSDEWLKTLPYIYKEKKHLEDLPSDIYQQFFHWLEIETARYRSALQRVEEHYRLRFEQETKQIVQLEKKRAGLYAIEEALTQRDYAAFRTAFHGITHIGIPALPRKRDEDEKNDAIYKELRAQVNKLEDTMIACLFSEDEFMQDMNHLYPYVEKLVEICQDYRHTYADIKEVQQVIDFDDMEHFALDILQANDHQVAKLYQEKFVEIMVDEFQDSNDVQNQLVMLICRENNVFRVGDIKQSIYGFRHAKPALMKGLITERGEQDEVIYLSNNYRSKQMIVDFNNILFEHLMNTPGFSKSFAQEDIAEIGIPTQQKDNVPICFHALFHKEMKATLGIKLSNDEIKASYIAHQILKIRKEEGRSWNDFVVLVRSNARKDAMKAIFDELHIPYFIDIKYGFYQSNAVQIMLSALKCLLHPHEDISFIALMLSPLFQRTTMEMAKAKLAKEKGQSYYSWFCDHPFDGFEVVQDLIRQARHQRVSELLNALYELNDYYRLHTTIQEKTNLDLLYEKAIQFEQQYANGLASFLAQIEAIKDAQTAEAIPIGSDSDVVRVMSIHQSKGLQFKVVFLWSTEKLSSVERKDFCISDADMGIAMKAMDLPQRFVRTTIPRIAMEHKKDQEELEEEMRILYVATTRAEVQMHIVGCIDRLEPYQKPLDVSGIYERKGYTSWILQTFYTYPSPLFTIQEVHEMWENEVQGIEEVAPQPFKTYQKPTRPSQSITASAQEEQRLPQFTLTPQRQGSEYGLMMHTMIEHLPQPQWSEEIIRQVAREHSFDLAPWDCKTLRTLGENTFFQDCYKGEIYHELSFMVRDGQDILHGYMDFVSMQKEQIIIIDFKTDALQEPAQFVERYHGQLALYKKAMHILHPEQRIITYVYSLHLHEMILVE